MTTVRAKFIVLSKTYFGGDSGVKVELQPVTTGSPENGEFFKYTPSGKLEMYIKNELASAEFEPGASYYLDFTRAS